MDWTIDLMSNRSIHFEPDGSISVDANSSLGILGEAIAFHYLISQGWDILHHRWYCRWGEIDLVLYPSEFSKLPQTLVFTEVKTRNSKSWDFGGLVSITPKKEIRLKQTAELFLSTFPEFMNVPCRFDLVLIQHRRSQSETRIQKNLRSNTELPVKSGHPIKQPDIRISSRFVISRRDDVESDWITLGTRDFRLNQHLENILEQ